MMARTHPKTIITRVGDEASGRNNVQIVRVLHTFGGCRLGDDRALLFLPS